MSESYFARKSGSYNFYLKLQQPAIARWTALWMIAAAILTLSGCVDRTGDATGSSFTSDVSGDATPWTHENFDADKDKFTFAVFSDLTGGERPRVFEIAVAQLNLLRPELIINVGDLIEGASENPAELAKEWDWFDERTDRALGPVFYVGGNHDLTGEPLQTVWEERYGRRYYHFVYKDVLFLVLDTEDNTAERTREVARIRTEGIAFAEQYGWDRFGETEYFSLPERIYGNITERQSEYFREVVAANPDVRWTFLFIHKPAWEKPYEDNFTAIEEALKDRPYTVFQGHLHSYGYQKRNGNDYIRLGTTGGIQFAEENLSVDHVTLVTVDDDGVDIANLLMSGILDKTGHIPLDGDDVCFDVSECGE